ncbi:MAG: hypothetical protein COX48_04205, partial [bacterium (Candidatus Stahlbacteria) CG23_combo_of_CG06-09_8_20_14_all_34_7]
IINVNISTAPIYDLDNNINGIIVLVQDITERIMQHREIVKRSGELQTAVMNLEILNEELQTTEEELLSSEEELRTQVEELDKSRKDLLEVEEKLRIAIKNANISVYTQNNLLEYTWVYNLPEGLTASMIIGKKDSDFLSQEDANKIISLKEGVLKTKVFEQKEMDLQIGGQKRYFNYIVEPMYENNDEVKGLICAAVDLTEKRRME